MIPVVEAQTLDHAEIVVKGISNYQTKMNNINEFAIVSEPQNIVEVIEYIKMNTILDPRLIAKVEVPSNQSLFKCFNDVKMAISKLSVMFDGLLFGLDMENFYKRIIHTISEEQFNSADFREAMYEALAELPKVPYLIYPGIWRITTPELLRETWFIRLFNIVHTQRIKTTTPMYADRSFHSHKEEVKKNNEVLKKCGILYINKVYGPLEDKQVWWNWDNIKNFLGFFPSSPDQLTSDWLFYSGLSKFEESAARLTE